MHSPKAPVGVRDQTPACPPPTSHLLPCACLSPWCLPHLILTLLPPPMPVTAPCSPSCLPPRWLWFQGCQKLCFGSSTSASPSSSPSSGQGEAAVAALGLASSRLELALKLKLSSKGSGQTAQSVLCFPSSCTLWVSPASCPDP